MFTGGQLRSCRLQEGHRPEVRLPQPEGDRRHWRLERGQHQVLAHGQGLEQEANLCGQRRTVLAEVQL